MAHLPDEEVFERRECANCGSTHEGLYRCSRCRNSWYCSSACQKSYWPMHRASCAPNEFADVVDATEPKFAAWMRKHGKQAVLKDDEVHRLERAGRGAGPYTRKQLEEHMYGRLRPGPAEPTYTLEERRRMRQRAEEDARLLRLTESTGREERRWSELEIPAGLGTDGPRFKWTQNQSYVEVFCKLPKTAAAQHVAVTLTASSIDVKVAGDPLFSGNLYRPVKAEDSFWIVQDGVLEIALLKRSRRGFYAAGETNYDTYWRSVLADPDRLPPGEALPSGPPPSLYYASPTDYAGGKPKDAKRPPAKPRALLGDAPGSGGQVALV
ncbi:unnamed protein product [Pedinophyceae sp. YPF-701]|nr:unnamed protein product [Pedinophyceae sp. YPF-701]